jgi:hypothetical protein
LWNEEADWWFTLGNYGKHGTSVCANVRRGSRPSWWNNCGLWYGNNCGLWYGNNCGLWYGKNLSLWYGKNCDP